MSRTLCRFEQDSRLPATRHECIYQHFRPDIWPDSLIALGPCDQRTGRAATGPVSPCMADKMRVLGGSTQPVSMREAAARLGVPLSTFQKHYREWGVPARKVGRSVKFMERELLAWIEAQPRVSGS